MFLRLCSSPVRPYTPSTPPLARSAVPTTTSRTASSIAAAWPSGLAASQLLQRWSSTPPTPPTWPSRRSPPGSVRASPKLRLGRNLLHLNQLSLPHLHLHLSTVSVVVTW